MLLIWSFLSCSVKGRLPVSTHRETTSKWSSWVRGNQPNASGAPAGAPAGARPPLPSPNHSVAFLRGPETAVFLLSFIISLFKQFWTMFSIHPLTELDQIYSFTRLIWNVGLEYGISNNPSGSEDTGPQVGEGTSFDLKLFHPEEKKNERDYLIIISKVRKAGLTLSSNALRQKRMNGQNQRFSSRGGSLPPRGHLQCLEIFFIILTGAWEQLLLSCSR